MQAQILLVHEELHVQAIKAAEDVPVDVAEVVTDAIRAVIGELDALTLAWAAPLALHAPSKGAARRQREPLELGQELGRERNGPGRRRHALPLVE